MSVFGGAAGSTRGGEAPESVGGHWRGLRGEAVEPCGHPDTEDEATLKSRPKIVQRRSS